MQREYLNRKTARPFSDAHALHITLRSKVAQGRSSLRNRSTRNWLDNYLPRLASCYQIRLYHFSNNGNHLHLVLQAPSRFNLQKFLRVLAGGIARRALGAEKGKPSPIKFWESRPYSRIISWGREFKRVMQYVERNAMEALRVLNYLPRNTPLQEGIRLEIEKRVWQNARDRRLFGLGP